MTDTQSIPETGRATGDGITISGLTKSFGSTAVLNDISLGDASHDVRSFLAGAYVRGASSNCAEQTPFEGSTGVFTKRRYRDRFNRTMVKRVSSECGHRLKVKARVRAKGTRGANWYGESRVAFLRKRCRPQMLWNITLAGGLFV